MEFKDVINKRYSMRQFQPIPIDEGLLKKAVELAKLAPSAGNLQAYKVFITKEKIAYDAPTTFVICADPEKSAGRYGERGKSLYAIQDATIFASYLQLAIVNLGLASVWVGSFRESKIKNLLKIPDNLRVIALIPVGYPVGEKLGRHRRSFEEIVSWQPKE